MAMRRSLFALPLLCMSLALAGCENMDPAYWLPDNKKKLTGDRREVFPEGVPGVIQGVPPELIRGNNAAQIEGDIAAPMPQAEPQPAEQRPQPKSRPRKVVRPIQPPPEPAQQQAQPAQRPAPRPAQPPAGGAWPSPQAAQQPQQQQAPAASGWPAPPAAGTFTR